MSAPTSHDPLVVNTKDGACWTRRTVTESGLALYALADVCKCPEFVMVTLAELAERGIVGSSDALPMPVGPEPRTLDVVEEELTGVNLSLYEEELENARLRLALASAQRGRQELRARVAELEQRETAVAEFVAKRAEYITAIRNCHPDNGHDYDRWQGHAEARRQLAKLLGLPVAWPPEDAVSVAKSADRLTRFFAPTQALREESHDSPLHHDYRVPRDLPEPAHPVPCRFPKSPGCTCGLTGADVEPSGGA